MKKIIQLSILYLVVACTSSGHIGLKSHLFAVQPNKIIWLQIPGLAEDHIAMLKFSMANTEVGSNFENFTCFGKMWNYNLYELRPNVMASLNSQITGSKNMKGECSDLEKMPIWNYLQKAGYRTGHFEKVGTNSESVNQWQSCPKAKEFYSNLTRWMMLPGKKTEENSFHVQEKTAFKDGELYFDRSCEGKNCYSTLADNVLSVLGRYSHNNNKFLFLIKDFSYLTAIREKNFEKARELIQDYEGLVQSLINKYGKNQDMLILVSSANAQTIDYPVGGKDWLDFSRLSRKMQFVNSSFLSPVWAVGARSENFCGLYEEASLFQRIMTAPKSQFASFNFSEIFN